MCHGYSFLIRLYIVISVLRYTEPGVFSSSSPFSIFLSLPPSVLFPHPLPMENDEMLQNEGRWLHRISWRIAIPVYNVIDIIEYSYLMHYAIRVEFSRHISDIFIFQFCAHWVVFFSFSVFTSVCVLLSSVGVFFDAGATVAWFTNTVLPFAVLVNRHCCWPHFPSTEPSSPG